MKRFISIFFSTFSLFTLILSGCSTEDPSPSPADPRTSFVGTWLANETETKTTFEVTIELDGSSSTRVKLNNFANSGTPAYADVSGTTITLVPDQIIGDGWTLNGQGALTGSTKINWTYTFNDGATLHSVVGTYTKQ
jgi:hypothetical protein